jgi:hypothetical protein
MKTLFVTILTLLTLNIGAQKFQTTGLIIIDPVKLQVTGLSTIDAQWSQLVKTNDSLKTALSLIKTRLDSFKTALAIQKNYSAIKASQTYVLVQDTIKYRATIRQANHTIDSLKYLIEKCKTAQYSDTIEFIGYSDTQTGTFTKITEKEYLIAPKFSWQILKRYPIVTAQGIKTKEVTITELKQ